MSHISHALCHTQKHVTSFVWMIYFTHELVMLYISMINDSCHTCVMYQLWMSNTTHTDESCGTYEGNMSRMTHHVTLKIELFQRYVTYTNMFVPISHPHHITICVELMHSCTGPYACLFVCLGFTSFHFVLVLTLFILKTPSFSIWGCSLKIKLSKRSKK